MLARGAQTVANFFFLYCVLFDISNVPGNGN